MRPVVVTALLATFAGPAFSRTVQVGSSVAPTLAAAIAAVPALRQGLSPGESIEIVMPAGAYRLRTPLVIDAMHGGTPANPLIVRGASGGAKARLVGSIPLRPRAATARDTGGLSVPAGALAVDLPTPMNFVRRSSSGSTPVGGFELFQGISRLSPSRWPAEGYTLANASGGNAAATVQPAGAPSARWAHESALWVGGYLARDWAFELAPVTAAGAAGLRLAPLTTPIPMRSQVRLFVENGLADLNRPGTYVLLPTARAVFLPVPGGGPVEIAVTPTLLDVRGARNVTFRDLAFDRALASAVQVTAASDITFERCAIRQAGGNGAVVVGGARVQFVNVVLSQIGERGVLLAGGNRATLTPGGHSFSDGVVFDFGIENPAYRPAIELTGVGNTVQGSLIRGSEHNAVMVSGNEHRVLGNEIYDVLHETEDAGAIYMGKDWTARGNVISDNYIHDLGTPGRATRFLSSIYLDDQFSGTTVTGNVLVGGDLGIVIGGGRDNLVERNLIVDPSRAGIGFDDRGLNWQLQVSRTTLPGLLAAVPVQSALWRMRYPALAALTPAHFGAPDGNAVRDNLVVGAPLLLATPPSVATRLAQSGNRIQADVGMRLSKMGALADSRTLGIAVADRARALAGLRDMIGVPAR